MTATAKHSAVPATADICGCGRQGRGRRRWRGWWQAVVAVRAAGLAAASGGAGEGGDGGGCGASGPLRGWTGARVATAVGGGERGGLR